MRLMKRKNYDFPDLHLATEQQGWVRVRDEGNKVTLSYKQTDSRRIDGTKEICVTVDSFEFADDFLVAIGMKQKSYVESKRESWILDGVEVDLDEWPWIKPFVEIEGSNEQAVWSVARKLGLNPADATHGSVEIAYQAEYEVSEEEARPAATIFSPVPNWLEAKRR